VAVKYLVHKVPDITTSPVLYTYHVLRELDGTHEHWDHEYWDSGTWIPNPWYSSSHRPDLRFDNLDDLVEALQRLYKNCPWVNRDIQARINSSLVRYLYDEHIEKMLG
jgi:hypothetical protein